MFDQFPYQQQIVYSQDFHARRQQALGALMSGYYPGGTPRPKKPPSEEELYRYATRHLPDREDGYSVTITKEKLESGVWYKAVISPAPKDGE